MQAKLGSGRPGPAESRIGCHAGHRAGRMAPTVRRSRAGCPPPTVACTWTLPGRSRPGSASPRRARMRTRRDRCRGNPQGGRDWPPGKSAVQVGQAGPPRSANRGIAWLGERATALGSPQGGSRLVTGSTATFELAVLSSACRPASADPMLTNPPSVQGHSPGGSEIRVADGRVSPRRPDEEPPRPVTGEAVPGQATRSSGGPSSRRHGL